MLLPRCFDDAFHAEEFGVALRVLRKLPSLSVEDLLAPCSAIKTVSVYELQSDSFVYIELLWGKNIGRSWKE